MPTTHRRVKSKDEELGKRSDDLRPRANASTTSAASLPWRWRKRRVFAVLAALVLLYLFVHNIPTDLTPIGERIDWRIGTPLRPGHIVHGSQEVREPSGPPSRARVEERGKHYYDGKIKYYRLATSLHGITRTLGSRVANRNVLFAASSLRSAANLIPMACAMSKWDRNYVHLAILGRDPLPLSDILEINGVDPESCPMYLHDGRPDYSEFSSDRRAEVAVLGAMKHINDFMHPQAIIVDDSSVEDEFFIRAMRTKSKELRRPLIEIPDGKYEDFMWMSKLDSGSLASWFRPSIDILIHVPQHTSGGLLRLMESLEQAEYTGLKVPRITVELPPDIETFTQRYLERVQWPPSKDVSPLRTDTLALRHRIPWSRVKQEEASVRFLESFYPTTTADNHVLVLSPQVELSPLYLHYLFYTVLEYRYSAYGYADAEDLMAISLEVPSTSLIGGRSFNQPKVTDMHSKKYADSAKLDLSAASPFLYQAPSASASLIFGDKWATLHNFVSNRLAASHSGKAFRTKKLVSDAEPAWLEYLLELMRTRGWSVLHPATSFVTVHNELSRVPEEFMRQEKQSQNTAEESVPAEQIEEQPWLTALEPPVIHEHIEQTSHEGLLPLLDELPFDGDLPELPHLPFLDHLSNLIPRDEVSQIKKRTVPLFREHFGGCDIATAQRRRVVQDLKTDDLFCLPGIEPQFDDEDDLTLIEDGADLAEAIVKATDVPAASDEQSGAQEKPQDEPSKELENPDADEEATSSAKEEPRSEAEEAPQ